MDGVLLLIRENASFLVYGGVVRENVSSLFHDGGVILLPVKMSVRVCMCVCTSALHFFKFCVSACMCGCAKKFSRPRFQQLCILAGSPHVVFTHSNL
jgi:hypothetical protein